MTARNPLTQYRLRRLALQLREFSVKELQEAAQVSSETVHNFLHELRSQNLISRGSGRGGEQPSPGPGRPPSRYSLKKRALEFLANTNLELAKELNQLAFAQGATSRAVIVPERGNEWLNLPQWVAGLQEFVYEADLDGALRHIRSEGIDEKLSSLNGDHPGSLELHARCLVCEVLDYGGQQQEAILCIEAAGERAKYALETALQQHSTQWTKEQLQHLKVQCWACLQLGMVKHYRSQNWEDASYIFDLVQQALKFIDRHQVHCLGTLSRVHYCLGLVAREQHDYGAALDHFSKCIRYGEGRLNRKDPSAYVDPPAAFFEYNMGRAWGLGMAWLAYAIGALPEAHVHIVAAQRVLKDKGVKFIQAYVNLVHACTERSAQADDTEILQCVIKAMRSSYEAFGGELAIRNEGEGHRLYAIRAANELAASHLCALRLCSAAEEQVRRHNIDSALHYLNLVRSSSPNHGIYCRSLITRCRLLREMMEYETALAFAKEAFALSRNPSSRCSHFIILDCTMNLAEAYYFCESYGEALDLFRNVRRDARAQTNPKVVAVCDMHIARCYAQLEQTEAAQHILEEWQASGRRGSENAFVRKLEYEVFQMTSEAAAANMVASGYSPKKQWPKFLLRTRPRRTDADELDFATNE